MIIELLRSKISKEEIVNCIVIVLLYIVTATVCLRSPDILYTRLKNKLDQNFVDIYVYIQK